MIVFTGESAKTIREPGSASAKGSEFMGVKFDPEVNRGVRGKDVVLSAPDSRVKVVTIATNEEPGHRFGYVPVDQKRSE